MPPRDVDYQLVQEKCYLQIRDEQLNFILTWGKCKTPNSIVFIWGDIWGFASLKHTSKFGASYFRKYSAFYILIAPIFLIHL